MVSLLDFDYQEKSWIYNIDKTSGEATSNLTIAHKKTAYTEGGYGGYVVKAFKSEDKELKKFIFDQTSFYLLQTNDDFKKYVKTLPKKKIMFSGFNFKSGETMIYHNIKNKNQYTILKF
jgi:hypothetical protein